MIRPTKAEIDAAIIDLAAGLFARHGFAHTSLQQIADAAGYSKAGLLHHFPSKQAIYDAVLDTLQAHVLDVLAEVRDLPAGPARDLAVVEAAIGFNFAKPGIGALGNSIANNPEPQNERLTEIGRLMYEALATDLANPDPERIIRVSLAFAGLGITTALPVPPEVKRLWRPIMSKAAMDALGH